MENLICPHCRSEVPRGATVCRGCQAEIEYGSPKEAAVLVMILAGAAGLYLGNTIYSLVGWIAFVLLLIFGVKFFRTAYKHRVVFKRVYRSR